MKLVYIYSELPTYVRVEKNLTLFKELYSEVVYIGCNRSGGEWDTPVSGIEYHVYEKEIAHGGLASVKNSLSFLQYVISKLKILKPDVVIFCNEEYYLPFILPFVPRPKYLVCEVLDSLAIRVVGPMSIFTSLFNVYCKYVRTRVDLIVEMTDERLSFYDEKKLNTVVIHNSPMNRCNDLSLSLSQSIIAKLPNKPYIFISGSILQGISGIETLLEAVSRLERIEIVFAGRKSSHWVDEVINHPKVNYLGVISPENALLVAKNSMAMYAHYKPVNRNYVFAAPNKLYDSLSIGKPLIINQECKASDVAIKAGNAFISNYGDVDMLEAKILQLIALTSEEKLAMHDKATSIFMKEYSWGVMQKRWISALNFNR